MKYVPNVSGSETARGSSCAERESGSRLLTWRFSQHPRLLGFLALVYADMAAVNHPQPLRIYAPEGCAGRSASRRVEKSPSAGELLALVRWANQYYQ
jgi:hypothetical protein